ncbi:Piwi domain-containing protein [Mrakia frigida]|uniref:Piwi domain-containing protein n=1 Tax=Mrakia frigida TaxID=29902 RepID=UPI003FCC2136
MSRSPPPSSKRLKQTTEDSQPPPIEFARRPVHNPFGSVDVRNNLRGKHIRLWANLYKVTFNAPPQIFHFDIEFTPLDKPLKPGVGLPRRLCWILWNNLEQDSDQRYPGLRAVLQSTVFDSLKNAYGPHKFPRSGSSDGFNFEVVLNEPGVILTAGARPRRFNIRINPVGFVNFDALLRFTDPQGAHDEEAASASAEASKAIQSLDVLAGHDLRNAFPIVGGQGRKFFNINTASDIGLGGHVLRGIFQSFRPSVKGVYLNVDTAYSAFVKPGRLDNVVYSFPKNERTQQIDWELAGKILKGGRVRLTYRGNPTFKILGFSNLSAKETKFELTPKTTQPSGPEDLPPPPPRTLSVQQYYAQNLNMHIDNPNLPLVQLPGGSLVPLQFLELLPGTQILFTRIFPSQTRDMIKLAGKPPAQRKAEIEHNRNIAGYDQSHRMNGWGVQIAPQMEKVAGRVLDPPSVIYHSTSRQPSPKVASGAWNITASKFITPNTPLESWAVLNMAPRIRQLDVENFVLAFVRCCKEKGMTVLNDRPPIHSSNGSSDLLTLLKTTAVLAFKQNRVDPQILLIIVPDRNTYDQLKKYAAFDLKDPLATQFVMAEKVVQDPRRLDQYLSNVAMKFNLKLRGENWNLSPRDLPGISDTTIFIGADVSHAGPGSNEPSVAAVVGSTNSSHSTYAAEIRTQDARVEMIHDMSEMVKIHLLNYEGGLPDKIIFFRDGLSEGELERALDLEVDYVKKACRSISEEHGFYYNPPLTFIVCGKSHRIRFFGAEKNDLDRNGNLPPGTIVSNQIVAPLLWDFYLQSHSGLIGTARPLHLTVLFDENKFTADDLQQCCHSLAFSFARATRSVSLVPPAYYAHIACNKARTIIQLDPASNTGVYDPLRVKEMLERGGKLATMWYM